MAPKRETGLWLQIRLFSISTTSSSSFSMLRHKFRNNLGRWTWTNESRLISRFFDGPLARSRWPLVMNRSQSWSRWSWLFVRIYLLGISRFSSSYPEYCWWHHSLRGEVCLSKYPHRKRWVLRSGRNYHRFGGM